MVISKVKNIANKFKNIFYRCIEKFIKKNDCIKKYTKDSNL